MKAFIGILLANLIFVAYILYKYYKSKDKEEDIKYTCCNVEITQEIKDNGLCPKCLEHL